MSRMLNGLTPSRTTYHTSTQMALSLSGWSWITISFTSPETKDTSLSCVSFSLINASITPESSDSKEARHEPTPHTPHLQRTQKEVRYDTSITIPIHETIFVFHKWNCGNAIRDNPIDPLLSVGAKCKATEIGLGIGADGTRMQSLPSFLAIRACFPTD